MLYFGSVILGIIFALCGISVYDFSTHTIEWSGVAIILLGVFAWTCIYILFSKDT